MEDIQRVVKYLKDENEADAENVESHFVVETSGKVSSVRIGTDGQSDGNAEILRPREKKEVLRRPSSWGRKLGPYDPLGGDGHPAGHELPGVAQLPKHSVHFEESVGRDASQLPVNVNLVTILLFCAVVLSVSSILFQLLRGFWIGLLAALRSARD